MMMVKNEEKKWHLKNDKVKHDKHVLNDNDKQKMINVFYFIILKLRLLGRKTLFDRMC